MSKKENTPSNLSSPKNYDHKRRQGQPRQEGVMLGALARSSPIGIYIVQEGKFQLVNRRFEEILGYSQWELVGTDSLNYVHPEDRAAVRENAVRILKSEDYYYHPYEYRVVCKSGEIKWVVETVDSIEYQGKRATVGNFMDITERKQAEELFRTLAEHSPIGVYIVQDSKFQYVNHSFAKSMGYPPEQLLGKDPLDFVWPEDREQVRSNAILLQKASLSASYEYRILNSAGEIRWVIETVASIQYQGKRATLSNYMDVTERKWVELELVRKTEELQRASQAKSEFLASMSHELRTPLNAIIGFSELILDGIPGDINDQQRDYLTDILESGEHLLNMINDVLDLSKLEAGKMQIKVESLDLSDIIHDVVQTVIPLIEENKHNIELSIEKGLPQVRADKVRLRQVLLNLLSNAIKFTPPGGQLRIEAGSADEWCQVSVIDNGIGISEEDQKRLFTPFVQAGALPGKEKEGTGLGLALTKQFIEACGGEIWLGSEPGKGSKFIFTLPLAREGEPYRKGEGGKPVEGIPKAEEAGQKLGKKQILVVDDDPRTRSLIEAWLRGEGYAVAQAATGDEGIQKAKELMPAAIILDIMMPSKDGWQVLQELKSTPRMRDIPVVVASIVEEKHLALSLGAADYFIKPIDKKRFLKRIAELGITSKNQVLVVDDNPADVRLVASILEAEGIRTLCAYGGHEGLKIAKESKPALIVLDILMPDLSGFEVIERLRKDEETRDIPVVVLTVKDLTEEEYNRLSSQVSAIMKKATFEVKDFLLEVKRAANSGKVQDN